MQVTWFNTVTNSVERASLPAQTISVKAAEGSDGAQPTNNQSQIAPKLQTTVDASIANSVNPAINTLPIAADKRLQWLFLSLWLLTALAWFFHIIYLKKSGLTAKKSLTNNTNENGKHYLALLGACKKNNAEQTLHLILPWLRQLLTNNKQGLEVHNIAQAQVIVQDQRFATALNELQQHLYGKSAIDGAPSWQGAALLNAIQIVHKQQSEKSNTTAQHLSLNP
jgi:hypothetical protein